jgi:hypothetical protein
MLQTISKPKVGCLHFKSTVKQIRAENNTFVSSINDIIDNIHGLASKLKIQSICDIQLLYDDQQNMYKVVISDNIPHGFKDIFNQGTDNPLNMGHIRLGHDDDEETSEFGTGFKKDIIYIAQYTEIYTRSVQENGNISFLKISFDIPEMCSRENPEESYEPSNFEMITEEQFKQNHKFDEGSTVILSILRQTDVTFDVETGKRISNNQFEKQLRNQISKANSGLINSNIINIKVNDILVEPKPDLFELVPESNQSIFLLYCELNNRYEPIEIFREGLTETGRLTIMKYNPRENKFKKSSSHELNVFKERSSIYTLELLTLTTKQTKYEATHQYNDLTDIVRSKRCFGSYKITKQEKDGYSNHIYNRLSYTSKKLNTLIGVGSNKRVDPKSNILMSAIHITQKETTSIFRKFVKIGTFDLSSDSEEIIIVKQKPKSKSKPVFKPESKPESESDSKPDLTQDSKSKLLPDITLDSNIKMPDLFESNQHSEIYDCSLSQKIDNSIVKEEKKEEIISPILFTVTLAIKKLEKMMKSVNSLQTLQIISELINKYIDLTSISVQILMKYMPMDNKRIQILLDLIKIKYKTSDNKDSILIEDYQSYENL